MCQINELRYETEYFIWNISRVLKVRTISGLTKYLADDKPRCSATYSSETERGYFVLILKPFFIHTRQESQFPETETRQAETHKTCHSTEASALIISHAEMLFGIPDTQLRSEAHGIKGDDLSGGQCAVGGEQDDVFPCSLNHHHTYLLSNIPNPYISCHNITWTDMPSIQLMNGALAK